MFERLGRSLELAAASWRVLQRDKSLLVLPLLSGLALVLIIASFALPALTDPQWAAMFQKSKSAHSPKAGHYALLWVMYLISFLVMTFFNTALAIVVLARADGHALSIGQGLREARSKLPDLLMYALVSATVGIVLEFVDERVPIIGKLAVGLFGVAWSIATYLAIPVLAAENVGPGEAIARSLKLLRSCWGEGLVGTAGLRVAAGAITALVALIAIGMMSIGSSTLPGFAFGIGGIATVSLVFTALDAIYRASLYRYAMDGEPGSFDEHLLSGAFHER